LRQRFAAPACGDLVHKIKRLPAGLEGFRALARNEGILPALEPSHVIGWLLTEPLPKGSRVLVCLSGRGDKDLDTVRSALGVGDA
jgi:tryptophan synthase beta subunit